MIQITKPTVMITMTTKVITKVRIAKKSNNNAATQATAKVRITKKKIKQATTTQVPKLLS